MVDLKELVIERENILSHISKIVSTLDIKDQPELQQNILLQNCLLKNLNKLEMLKNEDDIYKKVKEIVEKENNIKLDECGNIAVVREKSSNTNICLISKQEIKVPWVSVCGHVFDRSSILGGENVLRMVRCPVSGCGKTLKEKIGDHK